MRSDSLVCMTLMTHVQKVSVAKARHFRDSEMTAMYMNVLLNRHMEFMHVHAMIFNIFETCYFTTSL